MKTPGTPGAGGAVSRVLLADGHGPSGPRPEFFRYVTGDVASRILARTRHALTELDPASIRIFNGF